MKSFLPAVLSSFAVLMTLGGHAPAQVLSPITVTGYNLDPIQGDNPIVLANGNPENFQSFTFVADGQGGQSGYGLPSNGTIVSQGNPNATFQLAPYITNNVLTLLNGNGNPSNLPTVGTLTLATPGAYSNIGVLLTNAGTGGLSVTFNFADLTTTTDTVPTLPYWQNNSTAPGVIAAPLSLYQVTNVNLDEFDFALSSSDATKVLDSVTFSFTGDNSGAPNGALGIFAISGAAAVPEPSTYAMLILGMGGLVFMGRLRSKLI